MAKELKLKLLTVLLKGAGAICHGEGNRIFPQPDIRHKKLYHRTQLSHLPNIYSEILKKLSTR